MDTLSFAIIDRQPVPGGIEQYNVEVLLNGERFSKSLFSYEVLATAHPGCTRAKFGLYTCSCGVPECAGFMDDLVLEKTENTVTWTFPADSGYHPPKMVYVFDRLAYEKEVSRLYRLMLELERECVYHESTVEQEDPSSPYSGYTPAVESQEGSAGRWISYSELEKWVTARQNVLARIQVCETMLNHAYPELTPCHIRVRYGDLLGDISYSFADFVYLVADAYPQYHRASEEFETAFERIAQSAGIVAAFLRTEPAQICMLIAKNRNLQKDAETVEFQVLETLDCYLSEKVKTDLVDLSQVSFQING